MNPKVTVIIPTYNRADKVVRAVNSVLDQSFQNIEVIVVDDGSCDRTPEVLSRFEDPVLTISHTGNRGVSAARNTGIRNSGGALIGFLDSDDYWLPGKLAAQVRFMEENPEAVACQTQEIWIRKGRRVNPRKRHRKPDGDIFEPSLKLCLVSPSAVVMRRSLLDEVGLFDESLPACEDYDLWLRIGCRHPVHLIDRPLLVREGGGPDQLSTRHKGMDRFRIASLLKILRGGNLNEPQRRSALKELSAKCLIYGNGCIKRGKREEGEYYLRLPELFKSGRSPAPSLLPSPPGAEGVRLSNPQC